MKITITATLTEEELTVLAYAKGYSNTITEYKDVETPYEAYTMGDVEYPAGVSISKQPVEKPNPQTPQDYIRQVYEGIIIADATKIFTDYRTKELEDQKKATAEAVREGVIQSISSFVE